LKSKTKRISTCPILNSKATYKTSFVANELVRFFQVMVCYGYAVITNKKNWLLRLLQMIKNWLNFYKKRRTNRQKQRKRSKRKLKVKRQWNMFLMKLKFWENENFLYPIDGVIAPNCLIRALVICFCKD
jgi:chromatin segregation and condensation protein Rec8/ScpA/Scc1 (kleisin family)